jgi:F0F1-type ATP synthase membrane subunit b/b'
MIIMKVSKLTLTYYSVLFRNIAESREQRAESREQRAESREQRAESREQRAESREDLEGFLSLH